MARLQQKRSGKRKVSNVTAEDKRKINQYLKEKEPEGAKTTWRFGSLNSMNKRRTDV